jgi:hypothetical protein
VEVVKGVVSPPTLGTETWWIAVREAVYALRERACPVHKGGEGGQLDRPAQLTIRPRKAQLRRTEFFFAFFFSFAFTWRRRTASRFYPTPCEMNVKRSFKPTAEETKKPKKNLKTHNNRHKSQNLKKS